ncbi:hypothetical protein WM616_003736 [Salmonella enterica]
MPLPLREFYPIERAAELLDCKISDLAHWYAIGCIRIYIGIVRAYGILQTVNLAEIVDDVDFDLITENTAYKKELYELESSSIDKENYYLTKARIAHRAIKEHLEINETDSINKTKLLHDYSKLEYYFKGYIEERFSMLNKINKWDRDHIKKEGLKNILNYVDDDLYSPYIVKINGFFGLGRNFFSCGNFDYKFESNIIKAAPVGIGIFNDVYMHESGLPINIVVDEDVGININDLFIFKDDFIAIRKASADGSELNKKYSGYKFFTDEIKKDDIKYNHSLNKKRRVERHAKNREAVIRAALRVKEKYPESCKNYTKWAVTIHEHSYVYFKGECPLSIDNTKRLLSKLDKEIKEMAIKNM